VIAHSAASRLLKKDDRVEAWVASSCEDMWPAAEKVVDALGRWPGAEEPDQAVCSPYFEIILSRKCMEGIDADGIRVSHSAMIPRCRSTQN
jgi:hypothetical protein